jgi:head-tail joining protein
MALQGLFDALVTISRKTRTADGQGGFSESFSPVTDALCRFANITGRDMAIGQQKEGVVRHAVYFTPGVDVQIGDRLTVDGRTFEVRTPNAAGPGYPYVKALVEEYQTQPSG